MAQVEAGAAASAPPPHPPPPSRPPPSPPPPPPPPLPSRRQPATNACSSAVVSSCLSLVASYPDLLRREESLSAQASGALGAYDVASWMSYLEAIDAVLDSLADGLRTLVAADSSAVARHSHAARTTTIEAGGQTHRISAALAPGITHDHASFRGEVRAVVRARTIVGERACSLLPGSYKLWRDHLAFCVGLLEEASFPPSGEGRWERMRGECVANRLSPYLVTSSSRHTRYCYVVSAFERSLARLHKMPAIWLLYASTAAVHNPERDPTAVRRIYDRALVALPASQHDRVWEDYLCWVTGMLPGGGSDDAANTTGAGSKGGGEKGEGWVVVARRGTHKVKWGRESPLVAQWRKRGWGYHQVSLKGRAEFVPTCPDESALRVLRRHATCFDTTYREDLAVLCASQYGRHGEAASLLLQLLNNEGGEFLSPRGTTRHELWLRFADVCTAHPLEARTAGVDFDGIVRAVLTGGRDAGGGLGFDTFDKTTEAFGSEEGEADGSRGKGAKSTPPPRALDHRLGEMEGTLWTRLAEFHVRAGDFELARSVYEEALDAISRVRDFSLVFDAYVKFEEGVIEALMEIMEEDEDEGEGGNEAGGDGDGAAVGGLGPVAGAADGSEDDLDGDLDEDLDILLGDGTRGGAGASADVELAISRAEHLTSRRPLLLNRVLLRQNPHNVGEWIKRSKLHLDLGEVDAAVRALEESLKSVGTRRAVNGSPSALVLALVDIHENVRKNVDAARGVLERICFDGEYDFSDSEDLAQCHAAWVEMELRHERWDAALELARRAVSGRAGRAGSRATRGLSRSLRLWNLLFDLEESLGTVQTTKDAYDRALELKVATPSHVLNYASFLRDRKYFEESFSAYERGVGLFPFPHAGATTLWKGYLTSFLERYGGSKTPRTRELFERCLTDCPPEESPELYLLFGEYEEEHGLAKRALGVYERMCGAVPALERYAAYRLYVAKATQYLGVTSARPVYERAISALEDGPASRMCLEYAKMETGLREVDRARTVLAYGAQLADPRRDPDYWKAWHEFEVSHGNEETFREMLRVKRSVQAAFSTVNYNAAEMGGGAPRVELTDEAALEMIAEREGVEVDKKPLIGGFVSGKKRPAGAADLGEVERRAARLRKATGAPAAVGGDDEIDIEDVDGEEGGEGERPLLTVRGVRGVSEKAVPAAVFGGLAVTTRDEAT